MGAKVVINGHYGGFGLSSKAKGWLQAKGLTEDQIDVLCEECRHHPLLVECVETLKKKQMILLQSFVSLSCQIALLSIE